MKKRFDVVIIADDDDDVEKGKANPSVFICGSTAESRSGTARRPPVVIQKILGVSSKGKLCCHRIHSGNKQSSTSENSAFKFVMTQSFQRNNSNRICFKIGVNK